MKKVTLIVFGFIFFLTSQLVMGQKGNDKITPDQYINKYKDIAIQEMYEFKIPASITLAQGLLESGNGNSELAKKAKNHFGIKCHKEWTGKTFHMDDDEKDECFRKYNNPEESYSDHSCFLSSRERYSELFEHDITDYKRWAHGLKKAGYATNPKYAHILIRIIEENKLFLYDSQQYTRTSKSKSEKNTQDITLDFESSDPDDFESISISGSNRKVYVNNGIRCIRAKKGDNFRKISDELEMLDWQLARYNDMKKGDRIREKDIIYLQPKKKKGSKAYHKVKPYETMHSISQLHGIKLKQLYKKNNMPAGSIPELGQKLWLRKAKK
ncbi:MAG: glucosaminidase domain-containing protein [Bacteroidales bacterium]|nr:glucosaminidase domain-containing protein [Bacteroidales bacterium]